MHALASTAVNNILAARMQAAGLTYYYDVDSSSLQHDEGAD